MRRARASKMTALAPEVERLLQVRRTVALGVSMISTPPAASRRTKRKAKTLSAK